MYVAETNTAIKEASNNGRVKRGYRMAGAGVLGAAKNVDGADEAMPHERKLEKRVAIKSLSSISDREGAGSGDFAWSVIACR